MESEEITELRKDSLMSRHTDKMGRVTGDRLYRWKPLKLTDP